MGRQAPNQGNKDPSWTTETGKEEDLFHNGGKYVAEHLGTPDGVQEIPDI
jgi:hypothetical protein